MFSYDIALSMTSIKDKLLKREEREKLFTVWHGFVQYPVAQSGNFQNELEVIKIDVIRGIVAFSF